MYLLQTAVQICVRKNVNTSVKILQLKHKIRFCKLLKFNINTYVFRMNGIYIYREIVIKLK